MGRKEKTIGCLLGKFAVGEVELPELAWLLPLRERLEGRSLITLSRSISITPHHLPERPDSSEYLDLLAAEERELLEVRA